MATDIMVDPEALEQRITTSLKKLRRAIGPKALALHADAVMKADYRAMDRATTLKEVAAVMDEWCAIYKATP